MKRVIITLFLILKTSFIFAHSAGINYAVIPDNPRPGDPVTIGVDIDVTRALLFVNGRQSTRGTFFPVRAPNGEHGFMAAILTVPSTVNPGNAFIRLENSGEIVYEIPITITYREFASETIALNPVLTGIRTDASPRRTAEANRLWEILGTTGSEIYYTGRFIPPVSSTRRTSQFGYRRIFQYSTGATDMSIHAGIDYGVPTGTRVYACGAGRVVLAADRIVTGGSIIIEHAPGVYSLYYHLDRIDVEEGNMVSTGALIGLSGATGLATGPHLHWEIRVNSENTCPDAFIARPIIDINAILNKINTGH
jgi:murein DD-endopeptidase MepM/ murein hydrolase activator NlpD